MDRAVAYWVTLAEQDLGSARHLLEGGYYLGVAYHCQQALEKMLKALVQQRQDDPPPRIHNLQELAERVSAWESMNRSQRDKLRRVDEYGVEGRYPTQEDAPLEAVDEAASRETLAASDELMTWLRKRLASGPTGDDPPVKVPGNPTSRRAPLVEPSPDAMVRVQRYLDRVRTRVRVDAAWVFGSQVMGTGHADSDIDVAIISRDFGRDRRSDRSVVSESRGPGDGPMDVLPFSWDEYAELPRGSFLREVLKHGTLVAGAPRPASSGTPASLAGADGGQ